MYSPVYPAHLLFKAESPLPNNIVQPEIRVYEVPGDPQAYTYPLNSIAELQHVLDEQPEPSPWYAGVALHTGEKYLDFHDGIGVRAMVGAGSVVTRDIPDNAIVAGSPARLIRAIEGKGTL